MLISLSNPVGPDMMYNGPFPKDGVVPKQFSAWLRVHA